MTATCKTCRWWDDGFTLKALKEYEHGLCTHKSHELWKFLQHHKSSFCLGTCEDGHIADGDITAPSFGCIHHQPIPVQIDLARSTHKWFPPVEYDEPKEADGDSD